MRSSLIGAALSLLLGLLLAVDPWAVARAQGDLETKPPRPASAPQPRPAPRPTPAPPAATPPAPAATPPPSVGQQFRDCPECPEMVVVPSGSFVMGAAPGEEEAEGLAQQFRGRSSPQVPVRIASPFAVGRLEVTRGQFAAFVLATGHEMGNSCLVWVGSSWTDRAGAGWQSPGFVQDDRHPVVCVSWDDAQAYVRWLSGRTGKAYRLLSESEWEYAARAGTTTRRPWGDSAEAGCGHANVADATARRVIAGFKWGTACDDGHGYTAPSGSYRANAFDLHDMIGNVREWTSDCWNATLAGASVDGSARQSGDCSRRVLRGGSWFNYSALARSAFRLGNSTTDRNNYLGFRVARTL
jgi:sulfatase modifying factor 1